MLAIYGLELSTAESWKHRTQVLIGFAIQLTDLSACKQFYDGAIVTALRVQLQLRFHLGSHSRMKFIEIDLLF